MTNIMLKTTIQNISRSGWRAAAILFIMSVTFFILGVQMLVMYFSQALAKYFVERPEVIGFFKDGVTEEQIQSVKTDLSKYDYVVEVRYVSKEEALKSFIEDNKDRKDVIESITVNPFPAHLNVKVNSLDRVQEMADIFRSNELVEKVSASERVLDTLKKIVLGIQIIGFGLLTIFSITTFVILFLAIGITVYSQKEEIIVMKLVGATNWFVRAPYLLQSVAYGLFSSIISSAVIIVMLLLKFQDFAESVFGQRNIIELTPLTLLIGFGIQISFAVALSLLSSYIATKRYIKY